MRGPPRRWSLWAGLALLLTAGAPASDEAEAPLCNAAGRKGARAEATRRSRKGDFTGAAALLLAHVSECGLEEEDDFWILRDLARSWLRTGDALACRRQIAPVLHGGPEFSPIVQAGLGGSAVEQALEEALSACTHAQERARQNLRADACAYSVSPSPAAVVALPPSIPSTEGTRACLLLTAPAHPDAGAGDAAAPLPACPEVARIEEDAARQRQVRTLKRSADVRDPLFDPARCCLARTLRVGETEGKRLILIGGRGRACTGEDSVEDLAVLYEWMEGDELRFVRDESVPLRSRSRP